MRAYYDTGVLVAFYVNETFTSAVAAFIENRREPIPLNIFQQLELENAFRLKVFRAEMSDAACRTSLEMVGTHIKEGRMVHRPVNWIEAMEESRRISAKMTSKAGCRSLDLLHVAVAIQWKSEVFVSADDRQLKAARSSGLRAVDVRTYVAKDDAYGVKSGHLPDIIKEARAGYKTKKPRRSAPRAQANAV